MSSLSVCMMVQNVETTLAITLESFSNVYDELIIVDGGSTDSTCEIASSYGAKIIHSKWTGSHDKQRNVYLGELKTEWLFAIDADEFIDIQTLDFLRWFKLNPDWQQTDNYMIFRKWINPFSKNHYLISEPYKHDWQSRLLKNNPNLSYRGLIHEQIDGLDNISHKLERLSIYHLDLFISNQEKRKNKLSLYAKKYLESGAYPSFIIHANYLYLPSSLDLKSERYNQAEILPSVRKMLDNLECKNLEESQVTQSSKVYLNLKYQNQLHELDDSIYALALSEDTKTVLQVGSNLNKGVSQAFIKCLKTNVNQPSLFHGYDLNNQIKIIKDSQWINSFDVVIINLYENIDVDILDELTGAKIVLLDNIHELNEKSYMHLLASDQYMLVAHRMYGLEKWAVFKNKKYINSFKLITKGSHLPIHFFTIVLNGQPFIRYHIEVFKQLPFKWHWHIVEGVADLKHDTAWGLRNGGHISDEIHKHGRSYDGTTEYLDELAQLYPDNITIYRKQENVFWDGKREMVNAPLAKIQEECLLWQVDVDELWTLEQVCTARQMFIDNPEKTAAFYWCWYFVGEKLIITTRNCYAQNPQQEWLRTWRFKPGAFWAAHEPPILVETLPDGQYRNVAATNPFLHEETEKYDLIFQHFAYVTPEQLQFKEQYYGYKGAVFQWESLQKTHKLPVRLQEYFAWVHDETRVDIADSLAVVPIAKREIGSNIWRFLQPDEVQEQIAKISKPAPIIIVDGVFFQLYQTGIARVWKSLLEQWSNNEFAKHIIVLDRADTTPKIPGIKYRTIAAYDYDNTDADREMLQQVCDEEGADLFISSYYTTPTTTPSVFIAYDMIPEVMGWDMNNPMWQEKHQGIQQASAYIAISEHTACDLIKYFADIPIQSVTVAHCGVSSTFLPNKPEYVQSFKTKYGITKPYFIVVGAGSGYKNSILFFKAFSHLATSHGFDIICTGSGGILAPEFRAYTSGSNVYMLQLSDEELATAYSGAVALVYPSKYEGFGMPIVEAMACGCPVITCPNASIPEVAGEAAIYVNDDDVDGLANALCDVQKPGICQSLITAGLAQVQKFSWSKMADIVSSALIDATLLYLNLKEINLIIFPDWTQSEELITTDLQQVIKAIATHPDNSQITLLINTNQIPFEEAELLLSGVAMNLMMEEDLDISEGLEISLVGNFADIQWAALLPRISAKIVLEHENKSALAPAVIEKLLSIKSLTSDNFRLG